MTSAPTPTTGSTSQEVDERNKPPEQGGGGSHGLKGKKGNNQTKKGRNLRYVITAKQLGKGLVRGGDSGRTEGWYETAPATGPITIVSPRYSPSPLPSNPGI